MNSKSLPRFTWLAALGLILLLTACGGGTPTPSTGRGFALEWYVETTGSDSNTCDSSSSPCATIRGAFSKMFEREERLETEFPDLLSVSHTLHVGPGTFSEGMVGSIVHMTGSPVSIIGAGPDATILDARNTLGGVFINVEGSLRLSGFTVRNTVLRSASGCIEARGASNVVIENVNLENCFRSGFTHTYGSTGTVELINVNIRGAVDENTDPDFTLNGHGIANHGPLVIRGGEISGNEFYGINNFGPLSVIGTTIRDNQHTGIFNRYIGEVNLTDLVVTGNDGGLQFLRGVVYLSGSDISNNDYRAISAHNSILRMSNSTIGPHPVGAMIIYDDAVAELEDVAISGVGARADFGAVIWNYGNLTLSRVTVNDNFHTALYNDSGSFAAVYDSEFRGNVSDSETIFNSNMAELLLSRSLIAENETGTDPALFNFDGTLTATNVTVSGNSGLGVHGTGDLSLSYTTIADNLGPGLYASFSASSSPVVENMLIARNLGGDCQYPLSTTGVTLGGVNLDTDGTCEVSATYAPSDLHLGPLADNGGFSHTHELMTSPDFSPAINAAIGRCPSTDQRETSRPFGPACDVGAFESDSATAMSLETTPIATEEDSPATFTLDQDGNCRSGDSSAYQVVTSFNAGQSFQIDGRNASTTWFWILMPQGGHCWLAGSTGTASGPYDAVSIIALPTATPTQPSGGGDGDGDGDGDGGQPGPPAAPGSLSANEQACSANGYQVSLSWKDNSDNEDGFRIYHNGQLVHTVGANTTQYTHNVPGNWAQQQNYYVEAYNNAGAAQSNNASENGCVY